MTNTNCVAETAVVYQLQEEVTNAVEHPKQQDLPAIPDLSEGTVALGAVRVPVETQPVRNPASRDPPGERWAQAIWSLAANQAKK